MKALNLNQYRSFLGLSLAEESPFEGSLKENLTFGDSSITDGAIRALLQVLGLESFIKSLPLGLETMIHPEGKHLSYSIRKKLILARALLHQPKCLILEDPLDIFSKDETQQIIDYLCLDKHTWSIVVVSNNEYWATKCNQIIELKKPNQII